MELVKRKHFFLISLICVVMGFIFSKWIMVKPTKMTHLKEDNVGRESFVTEVKKNHLTQTVVKHLIDSLHDMWYIGKQLLLNQSGLQNRSQIGKQHDEQFWEIMRDPVLELLNDPQQQNSKLSALSSLIQKDIESMQNPSQCNPDRVEVCDLSRFKAGFSTSLQNVVNCLAHAYSNNKTLVMGERPFGRSQGTWKDLFLPISNTCKSFDVTKFPDRRFFSIGAIHGNWPWRNKTTPPSIPRRIAIQLEGKHRDPKAWWIGQLLQYLLKPNMELESLIHQLNESLGFSQPIVGMHVRRTDKVGKEAEFHPLSDYMRRTEEFYGKFADGAPKKRIYLATDDRDILSQIRNQYPDYEILNADEILSSLKEDRKSLAAFHGLFIDIYFLAHSSHLVCTMSSLICHTAYEMMQSLRGDASDQVSSLDGPHFHWYTEKLYQEAEQTHVARTKDEIDLLPGDKLPVHFYAFRHRGAWLERQEQTRSDIYSKGRNLRTNQIGFYPQYKVKNVIQIGF